LGKQLSLPPPVKIAEIIHTKQYGNKLKCTPFSVNTAGRCTEDTAEHLKKQVLQQVTQCGRFAIQLEESADASSFSLLMVFAFQ